MRLILSHVPCCFGLMSKLFGNFIQYICWNFALIVLKRHSSCMRTFLPAYCMVHWLFVQALRNGHASQSFNGFFGQSSFMVLIVKIYTHFKRFLPLVVALLSIFYGESSWDDAIIDKPLRFLCPYTTVLPVFTPCIPLLLLISFRRRLPSQTDSQQLF